MSDAPGLSDLVLRQRGERVAVQLAAGNVEGEEAAHRERAVVVPAAGGAQRRGPAGAEGERALERDEVDLGLQGAAQGHIYPLFTYANYI